nr:unnamed protein product [Spirometra erinaceieuropaei]
MREAANLESGDNRVNREQLESWFAGPQPINKPNDIPVPYSLLRHSWAEESVTWGVRGHSTTLATAEQMAGLSALALSKVNEQTIYRKPGTQINNEFVNVEFEAQALRTGCSDPNRVRSDQRETFTIPAGTSIPTGDDPISISKSEGSGAYIQVNDRIPPHGLLVLGRLAVQNGRVVTDGRFTAEFRVTGSIPPLPLTNFKNETVVLLNGSIGNEPVSIILATDNDGGGETFTLKILPGTSTSGSPVSTLKEFCLVPVFLMLAKLFAEM